MKNFFKAIVFAFLIIGIASCEKEDGPVLSPEGFQLRSTTLNSPVVLTPATANDVVAVLEWDKSQTSQPSVSNYTIQISTTGSYDTEVSANSGNNMSVSNYTLNAGEINTLVNQLPSFTCGQEMSIDVRIKATVGISDNAFVQYSNPVTIRVTPYATAKLLLAFTTDASLAATADKLASSAYTSTSDFQGFFYLMPGTYKFYKPNSCNDFSTPTVYGTNGTNAGALDLTGSTGFQVTTAGNYFIKVNLNETGAGAMTYTITALNSTTPTLGIFGGATRAIGFSNITPMVYDVASRTWSLTIELINGKKFGFKTNNGTSPLVVLAGTGNGSPEVSPLAPIDGTLSAANYNDGTIKAPGDFVDANTKTRYTVVVDVSSARNYTYKLTPNP